MQKHRSGAAEGGVAKAERKATATSTGADKWWPGQLHSFRIRLVTHRCGTGVQSNPGSKQSVLYKDLDPEKEWRLADLPFSERLGQTAGKNGDMSANAVIMYTHD